MAVSIYVIMNSLLKYLRTDPSRMLSLEAKLIVFYFRERKADSALTFSSILDIAVEIAITV